MYRLRMALMGLAVLTACTRSAPDREPAASEASRERVETAGAKQPPAADTAVPVQLPAADTAVSKVSRVSRTPAPKRSTSPVPRRKTTSTRPKPSQRPDSGPIPVASTQASERADTSEGRDTSASRDSSASTDASIRTDSSASTDTSASSDTTGYRSYPETEAAGALAAGTVIQAILEDSINSRRDTWGKRVSGRVMQNITGPRGEILVRAGTPLRLTVTRLGPARGSGKGDLEIRADSITIKGRPRKLEARIKSVPYELKGRGVTGEDAAKVGVGAAGGAVVGGVVTGKTKGAVVGGVVGAAAGAAVASQTAAKDVVVVPRTPVQVVLTAPLVVR